MARILWLGDAGCTTGFATVNHAIGDRLVTDYGHDIHVLAVNYRGDYWPTPMKLYVPTMLEPRDTRGAGRILEMLGKVNPEVVVSLNDPWVLAQLLFKNGRDQGFALARYAPIIAYLPVDGLNYPAVVGDLPKLVDGLAPLTGAQAVKPSMLPIAMSKFGTTTFPTAPVIYHGVETDRFTPVTQKPIKMSDGTVIRSKADAKRALQLPEDCVLAIRVDRNSLRKNYADTVISLATVMRRHPELHAWFQCEDADLAGIDLNLFVSRFPDVQDRFHWPGNYSNNQGWALNDLAVVYAAGDFMVSTSGGEGFGLTLAEACSMEVPVIAMNVSAIPEVVGPGGILLEPARTYVPLSGQDNWLPDNDEFIKAIEQMVGSRRMRRQLGQKGRAHVLASFSWDDSARKFHETIQAVVQMNSGAPAAGGALKP